MKRLNIAFGTILVALGCFTLSPAAQAGKGGPGGGGSQGSSIVGLWDVTYTSNAGNPLSPFETYQQWHSDGLEIETPSFTPGVCMGTWKQMASNMADLYHVGFTHGNPPGTYSFVLTETITVSADGNSYDGTYNQTFYDANGQPVAAFTDTGTLHATRISVP